MADKQLMKNTELAGFASQASQILKAGISMEEGISVMRDDCENEDEKAVLNTLMESFENGRSFPDALSDAQVFPDYMIRMVKIGEDTGNLDAIMDSLEKHYRREAEIRESVKSALLYPLMMACMILAVIIILLMKVMPLFQNVFRELGTEMTGTADVMLAIGEWLSRSAGVIVLVFVAITVTVVVLLRTDRGRAKLSSFLNHFSSMRHISECIASARFSDIVAMGLKSGFTPEDALDLARDLNSDASFDTKLEKCRTEMDEGTGFAQALRDTKIVTGLNARMVSIAARTGNLDDTMEKIAEDLQKEVDESIAARLAVIEPAMVVVMSVIVAIILLSVMFPLLSVMAGA